MRLFTSIKDPRMKHEGRSKKAKARREEKRRKKERNKKFTRLTGRLTGRPSKPDRSSDRSAIQLPDKTEGLPSPTGHDRSGIVAGLLKNAADRS